MATQIRRDCAQVILRMEPGERERIRAAIPRGSLNSIARRLLMEYAQAVDTNGPRPQLPLEDTAA